MLGGLADLLAHAGLLYGVHILLVAVGPCSRLAEPYHWEVYKLFKSSLISPQFGIVE